MNTKASNVVHAHYTQQRAINIINHFTFVFVGDDAMPFQLYVQQSCNVSSYNACLHIGPLLTTIRITFSSFLRYFVCLLSSFIAFCVAVAWFAFLLVFSVLFFVLFVVGFDCDDCLTERGANTAWTRFKYIYANEQIMIHFVLIPFQWMSWMKFLAASWHHNTRATIDWMSSLSSVRL